MNRLYGKLSLLLVSAIFALTLAFPPGSVAQDNHTAKLIEGAKKETSLIWYTSTSIQGALLVHSVGVRCTLLVSGCQHSVGRVLCWCQAFVLTYFSSLRGALLVSCSVGVRHSY